MKETYQMRQDELLKQMQLKPGGLTQEEAQRRLQEYGENALQEQKRKKGYQVFLEQFKDFLVVILIVAAFISLLSGNMESTIVIFAVIILNAILGTVFEGRKIVKCFKRIILSAFPGDPERENRGYSFCAGRSGRYSTSGSRRYDGGRRTNHAVLFLTDE